MKNEYKVQLQSKLLDKGKKTEYVLCGGDSRTAVMNLYLACMEANPAKKR